MKVEESGTEGKVNALGIIKISLWKKNDIQ